MRRVLVAMIVPALVGAACSSGGASSGSSSSAAITSVSVALTAGASTSTAAVPATTPPSTAATTTASTVPTAASWLTFGAGSDRRGSVATGPNPGTLSQAWSSAPLDGALYGEPIVSGGRVLVATEHNSVYAFDAATGQLVWQDNLGDPIRRSDLECGNIDPTGVTGTPVVDAATGTGYLVALVAPGHHDLVAIDLSDGSVRWRRQADPAGLDPLHEQQRAALTIVDGRVYIPYGGLFGDCGPYKGAVVSFPLDGTGDPQSWIVPTNREGGLWAPSGLAVDSTGQLFVSVGNAASTDPNNFDDGNAVVGLTPDLNAVDRWAPADWYSLSAHDADLGSIGPLPLDGGRIFVAGKNGVGYVLDGGQLGGIGGERANAKVCNGGAFGGSATNGAVVVVGCSDGPVGLQVGADAKISALWHGPGGRSGAPVIAGSTVWVVSNTGHLYALDAATGAVQSDTNLHTSIPGFPAPTVLPGIVFVPAGSRLVAFVGQ